MTASKRQQLRTKKGITAPEATQKSGVSPTATDRDQKRERKPSGTELKKPADASGAIPDDLPGTMPMAIVNIDEIDRLYRELRNAITGDPEELHAVKRLFEAIIFKNNARKRFG